MCVPVPTTVGVYVTEQLELLPEPLSVQGLPLKVPAPLEEKSTVPIGVLVLPVAVSVTVAVQVVALFTGTLVGPQLTLVMGGRFGADTPRVAELCARGSSPSDY